MIRDLNKEISIVLLRIILISFYSFKYLVKYEKKFRSLKIRNFNASVLKLVNRQDLKSCGW